MTTVAARPSVDSQPLPEPLSIPRRFNGPLESGNGGYCSGIVAKFLKGAVEASLRRPVPLDTPLDVLREMDGSVVRRRGAFGA